MIARVLLIGSLLTLSSFVLASEEQPAGAQGHAVSLNEGKIELTAPSGWKSEKPKSRIVDVEFSVPASEGDARSARVTIMGAGGGVEANIQRWIDQYEQTDGSDSKSKTKVEKAEQAGAELHLVSITGTYKDRDGAGPFTNAKVELREGYRMLAAIVVTKSSGHYFIKLNGPQKTVDAHEAHFRDMLKTLHVAE